MHRVDFDVEEYTQTLVSNSALSSLLAHAGDISQRGSQTGIVVKRGVNVHTSDMQLLTTAMLVIQSIQEDMEKAASKLAAQQAQTLVEKTKEQYVLRLKAENEGMKDWEETLARDNGYNADGIIYRNAIVDATVFGGIRERQTLHRYEYFKTAAPVTSINLNEMSFNDISSTAVFLFVDQITNELSSWGESIFGKEKDGRTVEHTLVRSSIGSGGAKEYAQAAESNAARTKKEALDALLEKPYDSLSKAEQNRLQKLMNETATVRDGELGAHIGYAPVFKDDLDLEESRASNIASKGRGQMGMIMLDFQWNSMLARQGMAELAKPVYDKKLWDDDGSFIQPPTIRDVIDIAVTVAVSATGFGAIAGAALNLVDDLVFAGLDIAGGYKSAADVGNMLAQKALTSAVSVGIGGITSKAGDLVGTTIGSVGKVGDFAIHAGISATGSYATSVASGYIQAMDFTKLGTSDWINLDQARESWGSASTISSMVGAGISGGLGGVNLRDGNGIALNNKIFDTANIQKMNSLAGGLVSNAVSYGMTGSATFNLANINGVGLFELTIGSNGITSRIGMGGVDVSLGTIASAMKGYKESSKVIDWKFGTKEQKADLNAINMLGWTGIAGNKANVNLSKDIWGGKLKTRYEDMDENDHGYYDRDQKADEIVLSTALLGSGKDAAAKLATVMGHEGTHVADNRIEAVAHLQGLATYDQITKIFGLTADSAFAQSMVDAINDPESWKENVGSRDNWKLTWGGQLVNDGQGWLKDENGMYINIDGTKSEVLDESKALGGNGIETGLMNIIAGTGGQKWDSFTAEEKLIAQQLMSDTGMTMDKAGFWNHNGKGQEINMYNFLSASGTNVSDVIFKSYYNNTVDSQLAGVFGIDLGFERNNAVPEILSEKYSSLVTEHLQNTSTPASLKDKYKFTIYNNEGIGTELFNIDENNPFLDDLIKQNDRSLSNLQYMASSGCNFMAVLSYTQLLTGSVFSSEQIKTIWNEAGENPNIFNTSDDAIKGQGRVENPDILSDYAFKALGRSDLALSFGWSTRYNYPNPIGYRLTVPYGNTGHYVAGDMYRNILYNSGWTTGKYYDTPEVNIYAK